MKWIIVGILLAIATIGCTGSDDALATDSTEGSPWQHEFIESPHTGLCYEMFFFHRPKGLNNDETFAIHVEPVDCALVEKERNGTVTNGTGRDNTDTWPSAAHGN